MITQAMLDKYTMKSLDEYKIDYGDSVETEIGFYQTFLFQTDYISKKIDEEYFLGASKAELKAKYGDILNARQYCREQINRLESKRYD